jgi:hypothetical protein
MKQPSSPLTASKGGSSGFTFLETTPMSAAAKQPTGQKSDFLETDDDDFGQNIGSDKFKLEDDDDDFLK